LFKVTVKKILYYLIMDIVYLLYKHLMKHEIKCNANLMQQ